MMIPAETWFPVVTLLAGTVLGGLLEAIRDRRAIQREIATRAEQRHESDRLRRLEFQRNTLIALQDECTRLTRHIGQSHHHDVMSHRRGGDYGATPLPDALDAEAMASVQQLNKLRVRVANEDLRALVLRLSAIYAAAGLARSEQEGDAAIAPLSDCISAINERIGELLREG